MSMYVCLYVICWLDQWLTSTVEALKNTYEHRWRYENEMIVNEGETNVVNKYNKTFNKNSHKYLRIHSS